MLVDRLLNKVTTYRLTVYYLLFLLGWAVIFSFFNQLDYHPVDILINGSAAVIVCAGANWLLAKLFRASTNTESSLITALILTLIIPPTASHLITIAIASVAAMAAKYLLTVDRSHLFNPAAVAVAGIALLTPDQAATWWVGSSLLVGPVLLGGLLLARKLRYPHLVWSFLGSYIALALIAAALAGTLPTIPQNLWTSFSNSALLFFAFVMLSEPLTLPSGKKGQSWYGLIVGLLYASPRLKFGWSLTPEIALCLGNVFSHIISPKQRFILPLTKKKQLTKDVWSFNFPKPNDFSFVAGQYLEWTLPHEEVDSRGNRRYFSIASSPDEDSLSLLVKFYDHSSSYKKTLLAMKDNEKITVASIAGDFTLPKDPDKKLAFIAGGVGITPFLSMIHLLVKKGEKRDIVLLWSNKRLDDIIDDKQLNQADSVGLRIIHILTDASNLPSNWSGQSGLITQEMIRKTVPDYRDRAFYLSGPQPMVQSYEKLLRQLDVSKRKIITDYFPGYVDL